MSATMNSYITCCVPNCGEQKKILHRFPNPAVYPDRFKDWLYKIGGQILGKDDKYIYKYRRVCHSHFEEKYHTWTKHLSRNAVPTLRLSLPPERRPRPRPDSPIDVAVQRIVQENKKKLEWTPPPRPVTPVHITVKENQKNLELLAEPKVISGTIATLGKIKFMQRCAPADKPEMSKSRAEYMRDYRQKKRKEKLETGQLLKKIARSSTQRSRDFRARIAHSLLLQKSAADPTTALANPVDGHFDGPFRLPLPPGPLTSTVNACNARPAEIHPRPVEVDVPLVHNSTFRQYRYVSSHDDRVERQLFQSQEMIKSRAEYMRDYRQKKRDEKLTGKVELLKRLARSSTQRSRDFRARAANSILLPNLAVSHAPFRLPFPPVPATSTATADTLPRPTEVDQVKHVNNSTVRQHRYLGAPVGRVGSQLFYYQARGIDLEYTEPTESTSAGSPEVIPNSDQILEIHENVQVDFEVFHDDEDEEFAPEKADEPFSWNQPSAVIPDESDAEEEKYKKIIKTEAAETKLIETLDIEVDSDETAHPGFRCNECNGGIIGFRYACLQCADYDLCVRCEARGAHAAHYVLRIPHRRAPGEVQELLRTLHSEVDRLLTGCIELVEIKDEVDPIYLDETDEPNVPDNPLFHREYKNVTDDDFTAEDNLADVNTSTELDNDAEQDSATEQDTATEHDTATATEHDTANKLVNVTVDDNVIECDDAADQEVTELDVAREDHAESYYPSEIFETIEYEDAADQDGATWLDVDLEDSNKDTTVETATTFRPVRMYPIRTVKKEDTLLKKQVVQIVPSQTSTTASLLKNRNAKPVKRIPTPTFYSKTLKKSKAVTGTETTSSMPVVGKRQHSSEEARGTNRPIPMKPFAKIARVELQYLTAAQIAAALKNNNR